MSSRFVDRVHDVLRRQGLDVVRFKPDSHWLARRRSLLAAYNVDLVLDVGASDGEYAVSLRRLGYRGRIVSFEPLPDAAERLRARQVGDPSWESLEVALGSRPGDAAINVAANSSSSSLLAMLPSHEYFAPESKVVGSTTIHVETLDGLAHQVIRSARAPFLKIDTQGYEKRVLEGAMAVLPRIVGVQVELSIEPLYEGAPDFLEMLTFLGAHGFELMSVEPGFSDRRSGRMLQFDALAFRPGNPQAESV